MSAQIVVVSVAALAVGAGVGVAMWRVQERRLGRCRDTVARLEEQRWASRRALARWDPGPAGGVDEQTASRWRVGDG